MDNDVQVAYTTGPNNHPGVALVCAFPGCGETAEYIPSGQPIPAGSVGRKQLFCRRHQAMNTIGTDTNVLRHPGELGRAIVYIGYRLFDELLDLPPDVVIRGIHLDPARDSILLHLEGPGLPQCEDGHIPERAEVIVHHGVGGEVRRLVLELPGKP